MYGNRYQKRTHSYGIFALLLIVLLVVSYLVSGLFKLPDVKMENLEENLLYVFLHPLDNWNDKSLACIGIGFVIWIILVGYITYYVRNFHLDIEQGSADWLDAAQASKELEDEDPSFNRILTQNLCVSLRSGLSNNNMIIIGSSGSFKTTSVVHQNFLQFRSSYVMTDVKGDTQLKLGKAMQEAGYTVNSLNLKVPQKSDRYNPFVYIEREDDLLRVVKAIFDACRPPNKMSAADPFWDDGVKLYLQALFYYAWLDARDSGRIGTMNDITRLCNLENQSTIDPDTEEEVSELQILMNEKEAKYGPEYPPVRDYRKLKEGAPDTVRSIVIMVNAMFAICETAEVKRIFSDNDINIRELGTGVGGDPSKKIVLFLVMPDNNPVYNFIISVFYTQMFDILIRLSDDELHAPLPIPVEAWMDEFYAGPKPADPDVLMGVVRSRNISMIPIFQSIAQMKTLFKEEKWGVLMDNAATVVYLGSGPLAESTHKYISEALGKATVDSRTDNVHMGHNSNSGLNFNRIGRDLMTPDEVKRIPSTDAIVFLEGHPPIYDTKAIPFDKRELGYKAPKELKKRYLAALALGNYEHPVNTIYDPVHFHYITVNQDQHFQVLTDAEEIQTYEEAAKSDPSIYTYNIEEKDLLYLSWGQPKRSPEDVERLLKQAMEEEESRLQDVRGLLVLQDRPDFDVQELSALNVPESGTQKELDKSSWNRSGSLSEMLAEHWEELSPAEQEEICIAMDDGLTEDQLRELILRPLSEMEFWRRAFVIENRAG